MVRTRIKTAISHKWCTFWPEKKGVGEANPMKLICKLFIWNPDPQGTAPRLINSCQALQD